MGAWEKYLCCRAGVKLFVAEPPLVDFCANAKNLASIIREI